MERSLVSSLYSDILQHAFVAFIRWLLQIELWGGHFFFEKRVCVAWVWVVTVNVVDHTQQTGKTSPGFEKWSCIASFAPYKAEVVRQVTLKIQNIFPLLLELVFLCKYTNDVLLKRVRHICTFNLITTSQLTLINQHPLTASILMLRFYFRSRSSRCWIVFL